MPPFIKTSSGTGMLGLTAGKDVPSAHVVVDVSQMPEQQLLTEIDAVIRGMGSNHSTVQIESESCRADDHGHHHV